MERIHFRLHESLISVSRWQVEIELRRAYHHNTEMKIANEKFSQIEKTSLYHKMLSFKFGFNKASIATCEA